MRLQITIDERDRIFLDAETARTGRSLANLIRFYMRDRPEYREFHNTPVDTTVDQLASIDPSPQLLEIPDQAFFDRIRQENETHYEPPPHPKPAT